MFQLASIKAPAGMWCGGSMLDWCVR